jgi:hypothetical protein
VPCRVLTQFVDLSLTSPVNSLHFSSCVMRGRRQSYATYFITWRVQLGIKIFLVDTSLVPLLAACPLCVLRFSGCLMRLAAPRHQYGRSRSCPRSRLGKLARLSRPRRLPSPLSQFREFGFPSAVLRRVTRFFCSRGTRHDLFLLKFLPASRYWLVDFFWIWVAALGLKRHFLRLVRVCRSSSPGVASTLVPLLMVCAGFPSATGGCGTEWVQVWRHDLPQLSAA